MPDIDASYNVGHAHSGSSDFEGDLKELRATVKDRWEGGTIGFEIRIRRNQI